MTRECPDPFPAPTETESQCRKEAPLATNSLKIAQNHELSASAHTFAPFLCTLFVNFVRIFLLLTLITQDLVHFSTSSLTERFLADARIAVLRCEWRLETRRIILSADWDDEEDGRGLRCPRMIRSPGRFGLPTLNSSIIRASARFAQLSRRRS